MEHWQQIESLFQEALQHDPAERDAWLREACRDDSGLRREVASLLANHVGETDSKPWAAAAAAEPIIERGSLQPGQCLGPYRIGRFIAAGGMGEVYRATDTRLQREVAIKVSAARFNERFEREARVIASLNHPHICQLYDVGPNYLVMELVEGPTLADRIRKGTIPLEEALGIARQIAEALEAAHEKGRVHRDLKPANVKVTAEGVVKVLDFGLAKAAEEPAVSRDSTDSPTVTISATGTGTGVILGTAAYMSPEQARGAAVDKRSDIWSFGVVLYEMLTGRHLFRGDTVSDTLAGVLKTDPDWKELPPETPASIRRLLRRCLERDRKRRLHDIADALLEIDEPEPRAVAATPKPLSRFLPWIAAALLALALPALLFLRPASKPAEAPLVQFELSAPEGASYTGTIFRADSLAQAQLHLAISPDGRRLAFVATGADGKRVLWLRPLDSPAARRLPGTEQANVLFWAPDSRWLAFSAGGKLMKIDVTGGGPQMICTTGTSSVSRGSWNREGTILFADTSGSIVKVSASGGNPTAVFPSDKSREEQMRAPSFLPDGHRFLYSSFGKPAGLLLGSLDGKSRLLRESFTPSSVSYVGAGDGKGFLLFADPGGLAAQSFDPDRATLSGEAVLLAEDVFGLGSWSVSDNGVLVFHHGGTFDSQLTWFDRAGKPLGTASDRRNIAAPRISPDQKTISMTRSDGGKSDIWLFDVKRGNSTRFTVGPDFNAWQVWSSDGSKIIYQSSRPDGTIIAERPSNGVGPETILLHSNYIPKSSSRDGHWLVVRGPEALYLLPLPPPASGDGKPVPFQQPAFEERDGEISPDGHWMLYSSTRTGRREVFVQSMPEERLKERWQISAAGGAQPVWRADGKEIFFLAADGKMMSVPVEPGPPRQPGVAKALFQTRLNPEFVSRTYDVTADGERFILANPAAASSEAPITVILNWPALLKK